MLKETFDALSKCFVAIAVIMVYTQLISIPMWYIFFISFIFTLWAMFPLYDILIEVTQKIKFGRETKGLLRQRLERISQNKYVCGICHKGFNTHQALGGHSKSHNPKLKKRRKL